jgi:hypothetical protein
MLTPHEVLFCKYLLFAVQYADAPESSLNTTSRPGHLEAGHFIDVADLEAVCRLHVVSLDSNLLRLAFRCITGARECFI